MPDPLKRIELVRRLHSSGKQTVMAATGGGSLAISDLLTEPGATRTVLEAHVPYSEGAIARFLGQKPLQFCSSQTARQLAITCFKRGQEVAESLEFQGKNELFDELGDPIRRRRITDNIRTGSFHGQEFVSSSISYKDKKWCPNLIGIGCTASLASDRPKRGDHRFHIAVQTFDRTSEYFLKLNKGARTREEEERLTADFILKFLAEADGIPFEFEIPLLEGEQVEARQTLADEAWIELLMGDAVAVLVVAGQRICVKKISDIGKPLISVDRPFSPEAAYMQNIFAGSFDPLHHGHLRMIELAQARLAGSIALEIAVQNVEKAPLDYREIEKRLGSIEKVIPGQAVWLTRATRFIDKAQLFPNTTFLVGADTLRRIGEQKYYGDNHSILMEILRQITYCGSRFLVFARPWKGGVENLQSLTIPDMLRTLCESVSEEEFCDDISSTMIREQLV